VRPTLLAPGRSEIPHDARSRALAKLDPFFIFPRTKESGGIALGTQKAAGASHAGVSVK